MLQELKAKKIEKKHGNIDLEKIKSTFQTTDLVSKEKEKKPTTVEDALTADIEEGDGLLDEESDGDYVPDNEKPEEKEAIWDEDENICSDPVESEVESVSSEEEEPKEPTVEMAKSNKSMKSETDSINADDILAKQK